MNNVAYHPQPDPIVLQSIAIEKARVEAYSEKRKIDLWKDLHAKYNTMLYDAMTQIVERNNTMQLYKNFGRIVFVPLFECVVKTMQAVWCGNRLCGYRFGILRTSDNILVFTDVISEEKLDSINKIRKFLRKYDIACFNVNEKNLEVLFWNFLLQAGVEKSHYTLIPAPGWFMDENGFQYIYHGYQENPVEIDLVNKACLSQNSHEFRIRSIYYIQDLERNAKASILMLYHFTALFRCFADYPVFERKLVLMGNPRKLKTACIFLKTLHVTDGDIVVVANHTVKAIQNLSYQYKDDGRVKTINKFGPIPIAP